MLFSIKLAVWNYYAL